MLAAIGGHAQSDASVLSLLVTFDDMRVFVYKWTLTGGCNSVFRYACTLCHSYQRYTLTVLNAIFPTHSSSYISVKNTTAWAEYFRRFAHAGGWRRGERLPLTVFFPVNKPSLLVLFMKLYTCL